MANDRAEGVVRVELHSGTSAASIAEDPLYREHLAADEGRFIDLETIRPYVTDTLSLGRVGPTDERAADAAEDTDVLADHFWSPFEAASAITLIGFVAEEPVDCENRARDIGALWYAAYRVSGDTANGDDTRFIVQFWWPTIERCLESTSERQWQELTDPTVGNQFVLASCERLR